MFRIFRRRWFLRLLLCVLLLFVLFVAATARLFVWPPTDPPKKVDAIVALDGWPPRMYKALQLARDGYAPVVYISTESYGIRQCRETIPGVSVRCFEPVPEDTRGEAEYVTRQAAEHHWKSLLVVSSMTQTTRARMLFKRCFSGEVVMDPVPMPTSQLARNIAYEWGAMFKALFIEPHC